MLVSSIFFFFNNVFKSLPFKVCYNWGLFGKRFTAYQMIHCFNYTITKVISHYSHSLWSCEKWFLCRHVYLIYAEPHSSVGSVMDLRKGVCWFNPQLGQYSFRGLMIVIATGFLSHCCPLFRQWLCGKAGSNLERILCVELVKRTPGKHG